MNKTFKVSVAEIDLPESINGAITETAAREYTIAIRKGMTEDEKAAAFLHEMLHIYHDDFNSGLKADQIESDRHAELERLLTILPVQ